jgi:hypothetical protein
MKKLLTLMLSTLSCILTYAQTAETEPNNSLATANAIRTDSAKTGAFNSSTDAADFFRTAYKTDGTMVIYISATNTSLSSGYAYLIGYDGRGMPGQVVARYIGNTSNVGSGITVRDTLRLYGRAADSFFFKLEGAGTFSYNIRYSLTDSSVNDAEPNNSFTQFLNINPLEVKEGHIQYTAKGITDTDDYYKTLLPDDGTLKIIIRATNRSGASGYIYLNGYDRRASSGQVLARYLTNSSSIPAGVTIHDTILIYGRAKDSFYYRFTASGAFNYNFKYEILDTSTVDTEPNNTFQSATFIKTLEEKKGHIQYAKNGTSDGFDFYKTLLGVDGTVKLYINATNQSGSGGYIYLTAYDGRAANGQIYARYISNSSNIAPGAGIFDTLYLHGRGSDSFFIKIESSGAFKYSLKYDIIDTSTNDTEPNNSHAQGGILPLLLETNGHIGYTEKGNTDAADFYKVTPAADGTVKIYVQAKNRNSSAGYIYLTVFDGRAGSGQIFTRYLSNSSNISPGSTIYDTIQLNGLAKDTLYFKLESAGPFSYRLKYDLQDTSTNDSEPNNTFATALNLKANTKLKGHIQYFQRGGRDDADIYKTLLPSDGVVQIVINAINMHGSPGYVYFSAYDARRGNGNIHNQYLISSNIANRTRISDTIRLYCRAIDTMYFSIGAAGAFQYDISYSIVKPSVQDAEPNNTFAEATPIVLKQAKKGNTGYSAAGQRDDNDFYRVIIPGNGSGSLRLYTEFSNTSNSGAYVYLSVYDRRRENGNIYNAYVKNNSNLLAGITYRDTLQINCINSDTIYLKWNSAGCFSYTFTPEFIDQRPVANTENERIGNTVGFRPQFTNGDKFVWDFGDGTKSTVKYPMKTFKIGYYVTKLIVTNSTCNLKDTAEEIFEIKGIEYYTPDSSGTGGDAIVNIFGGGLDTSTMVSLRQGSSSLVPVRKFSSRNNAQLQTIFDLHHANEGWYDMVIKIPGENEVVYKNGFRIGQFRYPYTWSEVVAPSRWRTNVDNKFKLVVGNNGNVNASGVLVAFIWPKSVDLKFDIKWFKPPASGNYTINTKDTSFNCKWEDVQYFYSDSFRNSTTTAIDTFNGRPYNGYMKLLLIPKIAAGSTHEIPIIARSSAVGAQNFITYTFKPNLWGSCPGGSWMDVMENMAVEAIDGIDRGVSMVPVLNKSPVSWLTKATKGTTVHMANLGQAMGAFYNYLDGTTSSVDESLTGDFYSNVDVGNAQTGQAILDVAVDKMVDKGIGNLMKGQSDNINNFLAKNPNAASRSIDFAKANLKDINDVRQFLKDAYKGSKDIKTLEEKLKRLDELLKDCPDLQKQADELKKQLDKDMTLQDPRETKTNSVTSLDPNAIFGPVGQGQAGKFISKLERQSFLVTFENVDTALASAQIVKVLDTLDKSKFDLRTFEFNDYTIGNRTFSIPKGRKQFVQEDSLSPLMRIRVNGQLDTSKGIITWQFTSIDPATKDIPVFEGFLEPNISKPEGEGGVSYTIQPWANLRDGSVIRNRAAIYFDNNAPIATNTWENIVDVLPPSSSVKATMVPGRPVARLQFTGSDASSGVGYYNLFVREGNGQWMAFGGSAIDTLLVKVEYGKVYHFCAIASDRVGNNEIKSLTNEGTVNVDVPAYIETKLVLQPNPADKEVFISGLDAFTSYQVIDISGRVIISGPIQKGKDTIDISALRSGMYIITVTGSGTQSLKLLKL